MYCLLQPSQEESSQICYWSSCTHQLTVQKAQSSSPLMKASFQKLSHLGWVAGCCFTTPVGLAVSCALDNSLVWRKWWGLSRSGYFRRHSASLASLLLVDLTFLTTLLGNLALWEAGCWVCPPVTAAPLTHPVSVPVGGQKAKPLPRKTQHHHWGSLTIQYYSTATRRLCHPWERIENGFSSLFSFFSCWRKGSTSHPVHADKGSGHPDISFLPLLVNNDRKVISRLPLIWKDISKSTSLILPLPDF